MRADADRLDPVALIKRGYGAFRRRPGLCIATFIIYAMVGGHRGGGSRDLQDVLEFGWERLGGGQVGPHPGLVVVGAIGVFAVLVIIVAGPIRGGYDLAMLRILRGDEDVEIGDVFAGFQKFGKLLLVYLIYGFSTFFGFLLFIIPGIYLSITLWPSFLIVMETDMEPMDAVKKAHELTHPHFWPLLGLAFFSFFLSAVGILACCVGILVTGPVVQLAWTSAYDQLTLAAGPEGPPTTVASEEPLRVGDQLIENKPLRP